MPIIILLFITLTFGNTAAAAVISASLAVAKSAALRPATTQLVVVRYGSISASSPDDLRPAFAFVEYNERHRTWHRRMRRWTAARIHRLIRRFPFRVPFGDFGYHRPAPDRTSPPTCRWFRCY